MDGIYSKVSQVLIWLGVASAQKFGYDPIMLVL